MFEQRLLRGSRSGPEGQRADRDVLVHAVSHRHHGHVGDGGVGCHQLLDLGRVDVDPVHDQQVVGAAIEHQLPLAGQQAEVAGQEAAVLEAGPRGLRVAEVAVDQGRRPDPDQADRPGWQRLAAAVDQLDLDPGRRAADRARDLVDLGRSCNCDRPGLVDAVADVELRGQPLPEALAQVVADGRGGELEGAQHRQRRLAVCRQRGDQLLGMEDGAVEHREPVARAALQQLGGVAPQFQRAGGSSPQRLVQAELRGREVEMAQRRHPVRRRQPERPGAQLGSGAPLGVADRDQLGPAGRTRARDQQPGGVRRGRQQAFIDRDRTGFDRLAFQPQAGDASFEALGLVARQPGQAGLFGQLVALAGSRAARDRVGGCPEARERQQRQHQTKFLDEAQADDLTGPHALGVERGGVLPDRLVEFAKNYRPVGQQQGRSVRARLGLPDQIKSDVPLHGDLLRAV